MVRIKGGKSSEKSVNISKGIVFGFFCGWMIVIGLTLNMFIIDYETTNPGNIPVYARYLPLLCYVVAAFLGMRLLIFIKNTTAEKMAQKQSRKAAQKPGKRKHSLYKQALFLLIFIFAFIPLLAPIIDQGKNNYDFSVYNNNWNGASTLKKTFEDEGWEVLTVQSSLSATERLNKSILLILLGTNSFYNPAYEIPYFIDFFDGHNALLLCHDHGSTSTLLWEIFIANMLDPNVQNKIPVTIFPEGILRDNQSYDTAPNFPIIKDFTNHPITKGINQVILSNATCALGGPFVEFSGWSVIGYSSFYSWVDRVDPDNDVHLDGRYDYDDDNFDISSYLPLMQDMGDIPGNLTKIPLGGYPQVPFMAKETDNVRVFVSSDASLFNNELIELYDNKQFAINIINWLSYGESKDDWVIVFDEAHIRPQNSRDMSTSGIFGFIVQYIVHLSTNPITAWIYPLLAIYTLRKYIPKKDEEEEKKKIEEEEKKEERAKFRTSSFFAEKINWYREKNRYEKALVLLYRRLERKLNALLGAGNISTKNVINHVLRKEGKLGKTKQRRIERFMDKIISIKKGKSKVRSQSEFEE
ncbi:MAG: hypothetical protein ACTSQJ_06180, partial [Promethearchaeota archaeon]